MLVQVSIGIVVDGGKVLVAKRHKKQHQGGLWEFPGGKVEDGESPDRALCRELAEEVGLTPSCWQRFDTVTHDYGDRQVRLHTFLVTEFSGSASAKEGNPIQWAPLSELTALAMPEANRPLVKKLLSQLA
ncbi:8-oxo-dGTP diphosphatase MutT [Ferrimonas balearica]|uniref:8-oxo-dGTP diphosphatase MutT n=1 Tax=Ferrimonas balearica TaxID=44012 RepID=UPI001C9941DC|nr:8-oxo-dGTP diphosphatase MutT [Ferrimonas balearica]MBY5992130.1 8-oxo-dGTP diphosphatase MutT [Ferrimonas balearica]